MCLRGSPLILAITYFSAHDGEIGAQLSYLLVRTSKIIARQDSQIAEFANFQSPFLSFVKMQPRGIACHHSQRVDPGNGLAGTNNFPRFRLSCDRRIQSQEWVVWIQRKVRIE